MPQPHLCKFNLLTCATFDSRQTEKVLLFIFAKFITGNKKEKLLCEADLFQKNCILYQKFLCNKLFKGT